MNLFLNIIFIFHFFQLNWKTDVDDNLIFDTAAIPCITYKLVCRNGACDFHWNCYHENIFRLSAQVCAGYEICWKFVDIVTKLKCNFSAFCNIMKSRYKRRGPSAGNFMSPKTFRNLFFSWASQQKINFRSKF